jgi:O-methyltransferase
MSASTVFTLEDYFMTEVAGSPRYAGQLAPEFQTELLAWHANVLTADCDFYHTIVLPDGRIIEGKWDLRGHESVYLGRQSFAGKRVLEIGPATGWISSV